MLIYNLYFLFNYLNFILFRAKIATGLISGKYSLLNNSDQPERKIIPPVTPLMFKMLVGKGHPDFSSKNQQDAHEFFLHLLMFVQVFIKLKRHLWLYSNKLLMFILF